MPTIADITAQARTIANLCYKCQDVLKGHQLVEFFKANPERTTALTTAAAGLKSYPIVLYGLKEALDSEVLPSKDELENRPSNWLAVGDLIVGWVGYVVDKPRVVVEVTLDGYHWRYLDEDEEVSRKPNRYDPFFRNRGWVKMDISATSIDDAIAHIHQVQTEEIEQLQSRIEYFANREFLN